METELAKESEVPVTAIQLVEEQIPATPIAKVQQPVVRKTYKAPVKVADTEPAVISSDDDMEESEVITIRMKLMWLKQKMLYRVIRKWVLLMIPVRW